MATTGAARGGPWPHDGRLDNGHGGLQSDGARRADHGCGALRVAAIAVFCLAAAGVPIAIGVAPADAGSGVAGRSIQTVEAARSDAGRGTTVIEQANGPAAVRPASAVAVPTSADSSRSPSPGQTGSAASATGAPPGKAVATASATAGRPQSGAAMTPRVEVEEVPSVDASPTPAAAGTVPRGGAAATPAPAVWAGSFDLYRPDVFVTQADPTWCTAAATQMMLRLASPGGFVRDRQAALYAYGYAHRAYAFREPGLDPAAWVAMLDSFGHLPYVVVAAATPGEALREAARQLRVTHRAVGLVVGRHGDHSWVMTGFTATADPADTDRFTVTGVWVLGPNWPRQRYYRGVFDSPPHTYFTAAQMNWIMDRYGDPLGHTVWDGRYVAVVPAS